MGSGGQLLCLIATSLLLAADVAAIPLEQFYPFGVDSGDSFLPKNDDSSTSAIELPSQFSFFGRMFGEIYVNNNGHLSFEMPFSSFIAEELPVLDVFLVAMFWADVDTRPEDGGLVWYRITTSPDLLQKALSDIQKTYPTVSDLDYLFIATWDHVGYYQLMTDKTNTFQCVLARSGTRSYAIYLYADGLIQWPSAGEGFGGNAALVGYNAGDGLTSFTVPGSQTDDIVNTVFLSNSGIPGMWVFRFDSEELVLPSCQESSALLFLSPRHGSQLGGTPVQVLGPCFVPSDVVICSFGDISTPGVYFSRDSVICVSPAMSALGRIEVTVEIRSPSDTITFQGKAYFTSIPITRAHGVDVQPSILLQFGTDIQLSWDPETILPMIAEHNSFMVDVYVYTYEKKTQEWIENVKHKDLQNTGQAQINLGLITDKKSVFATCIHVTVGKTTGSSSPNTREFLERFHIAEVPFPNRAGLWSGLVFSTHNTAGLLPKLAMESLRNKFLPKCSAWRMQKAEKISTDVIKSLPPCPPTLDRAQLPNSGLEEQRLDSVSYTTMYHDMWMSYFHNNIAKCFTQVIVTSGDAGQECCYDDEGNLVVGRRTGGSINRFAPVDLASFHQHIESDVIPYIYCCPGACGAYYRRRPSDDGSNYRPPPPACIYGDPHVITLDGLRYTFNGKGEFTLIETDSNSFSLQGRMVEVEPSPSAPFAGGESPATVFSAIVGKQIDSDVVQFSLNADDMIDTFINGELVDFESLDEHSFLNVVVMDKGNSTYSATFSGGVYIEVRAANGIISLLLVSLTNNFVNTTRGLMGSFNGDTLDDLAPKVVNGTGEPIPSTSSLEDIHFQFGITWIVDNPEDSLFTYSDSLGESWTTFYDPDYIPAFAPAFDDPILEEQAMEICGDSLFCLFDIAATKRPEIGMTTAVNNNEYEMVINMSQPVVCVPACENGACIATNSCLCTEGYIGNTCSEPVISECEENLCENGGSCEMLAGSIICTCPPHLTGILCDNLLPPRVVSDTVADTPLMSAPLDIDPIELGFTDYRDLVSLCYEVRGAPRQNFNLVSTRCTSITARYSSLVGNSPTTTFGAVGIRTRGSDRGCHNIQVNRDCSVLYDKEAISSNLTVNDISIQFLSPDSVRVTVPNCGKEIVVHILCQQRPLDSVPVMNMTIVRSYAEPEIAHGLIGQFWSAAISTEPYDGNTADVTPGYPPYTVTVDHPEAAKSRKFVGVLIPRLWNHDPGQCVYAGNGQGGPTGQGQMDSVIQGEYIDYRVRGLFGVDYSFSQFQENLCF